MKPIRADDTMEFDFATGGAPEVSPADVERIVAILTDAADWMTAAAIAAKLGEGFTDRHVRKAASAACPVIVSFPGSRGYKLWKLCTVEEIDHCIYAFESQGKDMIRRSVVYRTAYHRHFRGAPGMTRACQPPAAKRALTDV